MNLPCRRLLFLQGFPSWWAASSNTQAKQNTGRHLWRLPHVLYPNNHRKESCGFLKTVSFIHIHFSSSPSQYPTGIISHLWLEIPNCFPESTLVQFSMPLRSLCRSQKKHIKWQPLLCLPSAGNSSMASNWYEGEKQPSSWTKPQPLPDPTFAYLTSLIQWHNPPPIWIPNKSVFSHVPKYSIFFPAAEAFHRQLSLRVQLKCYLLTRELPQDHLSPWEI